MSVIMMGLQLLWGFYIQDTRVTTFCNLQIEGDALQFITVRRGTSDWVSRVAKALAFLWFSCWTNLITDTKISVSFHLFPMAVLMCSETDNGIRPSRHVGSPLSYCTLFRSL